MSRSFLVVIVLVAVPLLFVTGLFLGRLLPTHTAPASSESVAPVEATKTKASSDTNPDLAPTNIYAHNLLLRKGPDFRFYVRWLRGKLTRAKRNVNPSFDDPDSFYIDIETGVLRANLGDLVNFLNASGLKNSPLKKINLTGDGDQVKLTGTVHKVVSLPIELRGTIGTASENRVRLHVDKINVLKIPFKGLLKIFSVSVADLVDPKGVPGVQIVENDIFFDTQRLLPPPHIRGHLTAVRIANPDLEEVFGNAQSDVDRVEQWRNFLRLRNGTLDFGKLTMRHVDLVMIDVSRGAWFDLDLANYQAQLVNGFTRMTPQAGLQIFMPELSQIANPKVKQDISVQWMKNRNLPPPDDVVKDGK